MLPAVAGCGDTNKASVSGTVVRKDGSPLVGARVVARSKETGTSGTGLTDQQGKYELGTSEIGDGIPPGNYYVIVIEDLGDPDNPQRPRISTKYMRPSASGLQLGVQAGENMAFDMTLDPP